MGINIESAVYDCNQQQYPYPVIIGNMFELLTGGEIQKHDIPDISGMTDFAQIQQTLAPAVEMVLDYIPLEEGETLDQVRDANRDFLNGVIEGFYHTYYVAPQASAVIGTVEEEEPGINTSQLHIGMVVSNYRKLCELLGEEIKEGNSRKSQIANWKRNFDWARDGNRYIILDIYEHPLPREDGRRDGNRAIYVRLVETVLAYYLSKCEGHTKTLTRRGWQELLGMVNKRYYKYNRFNTEPLLELKAVSPYFSEWEIKHFYYRSWRKLNEILRNALKSLRDRALIEYKIETVIVPVDSWKSWFAANDREEEEILKARHKVLEEMGLQKEQQVYCTYRQGEFFDRVNEILKKQHGWKRYFRQIKIIYNLENIQNAVPKLEAELDMYSLNGKIVKALNDEAENTYEKAMQNYINGAYWQPPDNYLYAQSQLADYLISLSESKDTIEYLLAHPDSEVDELFNEPLDTN